LLAESFSRPLRNSQRHLDDQSLPVYIVATAVFALRVTRWEFIAPPLDRPH
jgi:hypothetical protein